MARTVITMEDLNGTKAITYLDGMLHEIEEAHKNMATVIDEVTASGQKASKRDYVAVGRASKKKHDILETLTDELLANDYAPDVWAYVGEKLNELE